MGGTGEQDTEPAEGVPGSRGEQYRTLANELRERARQALTQAARQEMEQLAAQYERLADLYVQ